jgi:hypothetical protein
VASLSPHTLSCTGLICGPVRSAGHSTGHHHDFLSSSWKIRRPGSPADHVFYQETEKSGQGPTMGYRAIDVNNNNNINKVS